MLNSDFAILGACLGFSANLIYAAATWRGSIVPNRVTWYLWTAIPLIIFAASESENAGLPSLFSLAAGLGPAVVVLVILVRRRASYWKITRLDVCCGVLSLVAIGLWVSTRDGDYAIALSLAADLAAAFPTLVKAYKEPSSESATAYVLYMVGAVVVLLATKKLTTANSAFPLYAAILYFSLSFLIISRRALALKQTDRLAPRKA
ncbi:MAG TPA: hypothetical protein VND83_10375 [Acidimicrobiales bacterium]|nr:hypothetical protein [Acidimicrobiales bacterium]